MYAVHTIHTIIICSLRMC